jgi:enoyl-CoA hydratase/3-hydroxyacyl-CoA dehydrogenase
VRAPVPEIRTVCYVGAGTMGCVNSLVAAVSGYDVVLYDFDPASLALVSDRQRGFADHMVAIGYCDADAIPAALARVRTTSDPADAAHNADLISESVIEQVDIKRDALALFDRLCASGTILTTNTSSLLVSELEGALQRPERFAALHSHLGSPLYDIVGGTHTSPATIDLLERFVVSLGGVPLVLRREHRGYVVNGLIGGLTMSALQLLVRSESTVESIDRAWMSHQAAPFGPFGLLDLFGLDVVADNLRNATETTDRSTRRSEVLPLLDELVERGRLGMKTGGGFYDYPNPAFQHPDFLDDGSETSTLSAYLVAAVIHRAALIAAAGIAEREDIDRAWLAAMGLGVGPFGLLDEIGPDGFREMSRRQVEADLLSAEDSEAVEAFLGNP